MNFFQDKLQTIRDILGYDFGIKVTNELKPKPILSQS